ncbi:MAG: hypothetical protein OXF24_09110 [Hyphomicrobiales bacterium]|nr:hypothetical protein [Hyphomicrobiales bacterium]MCY4053060.1 hypothetical protein [Hyphomicrobiales bacterium]
MRDFVLNVLTGFCLIAVIGGFAVGTVFGGEILIDWMPIVGDILLWTVLACGSIGVLWLMGGIFRGRL